MQLSKHKNESASKIKMRDRSRTTRTALIQSQVSWPLFWITLLDSTLMQVKELISAVAQSVCS